MAVEDGAESPGTSPEGKNNRSLFASLSSASLASSSKGFQTSPLSRSGSAPLLPRTPSRPDVPEHIRKEFVRYSTPLNGPMGRNNVKVLHKYFKFHRYIDGAENRGVALTKLIEIYRYAADHCADWHLTLSSINLYMINDWLIKPVTKEHNSAMAEHLSSKKLVPTWFISHWWGEIVADVLKSIRQHMAVRGLSNNVTFYWLSAIAMRQHDLDSDIWSDLRDISFYKALRLTRFRVLFITSSGSSSALCRTWCAFELAMCMDRTSPSMDIAACGPNPELITSGIVTSEIHGNNYLPGRGFHSKILREQNFPAAIMKDALTFNFLKTETSIADDKFRMLNCVTGQPLDGTPAVEHDKYYEMSRRLRSFLTFHFWQRALAEVSMQEAPRDLTMLEAMAKAVAGDWWRRNLDMSVAGCNLLDEEMVLLVVKSIPSKLVRLSLDLQHTDLTNESLVTLAKSMPPSLSEWSLDVSGCGSITDDGILSFLQALPDHFQKLDLRLFNTQVSEGVTVLSKEPLETMRSWAGLSLASDQKAMLVNLVKAASGSNLSPDQLSPAKHNRRQALKNMLLLQPARLKDELREQIEAELEELGEEDEHR